jgi:hypothetical protein
MILPYVWSNPYCLKETRRTNTLNLHLNSKCVWIRNSIRSQDRLKSIPVAPWSRACVCGHSLAGIAGSNPTGGMYICLVSFVCCQVEVSALGWSPRQYESCRVLCVTEREREASTMTRSWPNRDHRAMGRGGGGKIDWNQEDVFKDCTAKRLMIFLNLCCP